jgi:SAM-dependent methyltransferase
MVSWKKYINKRKNIPPRELLLKALSYVPGHTIALDLGAGPMNDSRYLLGQGFERIISVDYDDTAEECAKEFAEDGHFLFVKQRFDDFEFPSGVDLINAAYALPFNPPQTFERLIENIKQSLKEGGVFCGQLFGHRDSWNVLDTDKTFLVRKEAEGLFQDMEVLKFFEEEGDGHSALGEAKHWHVFHFIVRK